MAIRGDELLRMSNEDILRLYYGDNYKQIFAKERQKREAEEKEFNEFMNKPIYIPRAVGLRGCFID